MILYSLGQAMLRLLSAVLVVSLPAFPDVVSDGLNTVQSVLISGVGLVSGIFGYQILHAAVTCCRLVLLLFALWLAYDLFRWVASKIPFLGVR